MGGFTLRDMGISAQEKEESGGFHFSSKTVS